MSSDLKSEIEARKARIAELRRQREAHSRSSGPSSRERHVRVSQQQMTRVAPSEPLVNISRPRLQEQITQTDPLIESVVADVDQPLLDSDDETGLDAQKSERASPNNVPKPFQVRGEHDLVSPTLDRFLDDAWRAVARSESSHLATPLRDYTSVGLATSQRQHDQSESSSGLYKTASLGESVAALDWSPFFLDLAVASAAHDTRAYIWSIEAPEHPEFVLRAPTIISALQFSAQSAQIVYGGGMNGQVFLWDLKDMTKGGSRYERLPQLRSPADTAPIISLKVAPASNALLSLSADGTLAVWSSDVFSAPLHRLQLDEIMRAPLHNLKIGIVVPTAMAIFYPPDYGYGLGYGTGLCVVGMLTGHLLRIPSSETAERHAFTWHHAGPISALSFRRLSSTNTEDGSRGAFLLSAGLDWRIRLWYVPLDEFGPPIETLTVTVDFNVRDLQWHPTLSTVFAAVGDAQLQIWDFSQSAVQPQLSLTSQDDKELSVVRFGARDASCVAAGGPECGVSVYTFAEKQFGTSGESWLTSLIYKSNNLLDQ